MVKSPTNGFVETELGWLPSTWKVAPLGDFLHFTQYGLSVRGEQTGKYPILRMNSLQKGTITTNSLQYVDLNEEEFQKFRLETGDIVFNRTNSIDLVGKTSYFDVPGEFVFASYLIRLKCDTDRLEPTFLNLFLNYGTTQTRLKQLATRGVSQSNINATKLKGLLVVAPPLDEQRAIAGVLRTVQRAKEATEKVIAAARQLKQSLMRHLFTYGPVPFQQADHVELQETDLGEAPQHWAKQLLDECCVVQTGAAKGRRFGDDETVELPYLRVANVQGGYLDLREMKTITIRKREIDRYSLKDGDVVLTEGGDFDKLGRGFIWRNEVPGCLHQNHVYAVRADRSKLLPEFVAHQT